MKIRHAPLALAALFALQGCAERDGRSDVLALYFPKGREAPAELIEGVEEIYGLEILIHDNSYGAVQVYLYDSATDGYWGSTQLSHECTRALWTVSTVRAVSHQIGHAFGLDDQTAADNVMSTNNDASSLTDDQVDMVRTVAWYQQQCRD